MHGSALALSQKLTYSGNSSISMGKFLYTSLKGVKNSNFLAPGEIGEVGRAGVMEARVGTEESKRY
jgi:hypothetical protein